MQVSIRSPPIPLQGAFGTFNICIVEERKDYGHHSMRWGRSGDLKHLLKEEEGEHYGHHIMPWDILSALAGTQKDIEAHLQWTLSCEMLNVK